jgi:hypothetical protein
MDYSANVERLVRDRASLLDEAASIVQAAGMAGRTVSTEEDARVLVLMARVRNLEEQLGHLKLRHQEVKSRNRSNDK